MPTVALQNALLVEACRVLRPGGWLTGVDSLDNPGWREFHEGDVCVPADPATFAARLRAAGFAEVQVEQRDESFRRCRWRRCT